ncbi:MAG TPA: hypothetical protein VG796_10475 [Verrucomicrobiales bacterium]|jgi:hypothetical protein|nr:hypothetical protein [Verrucomicrobiales bacterium]
MKPPGKRKDKCLLSANPGVSPLSPGRAGGRLTKQAAGETGGLRGQYVRVCQGTVAGQLPSACLT